MPTGHGIRCAEKTRAGYSRHTPHLPSGAKAVASRQTYSGAMPYFEGKIAPIAETNSFRFFLSLL